ncbi:unnamed protein product [Toxocara canis]|uniref:RING-type domain-containing protein n=1 Tax=Toxocara canis TaxID=6265 RepID=A0A183UAL3_TOXCA|nr:unnamed protein product [Toxocara canis]
MAPNHSTSSAPSSTGFRRTTRTSRGIRKRSGAPTVNANSLKRSRTEPNNSRTYSLRSRNTGTGRRASAYSSDTSSEEDYFDSRNESRVVTRRMTRGVRQNSTSVLGSGVRRQQHESFGVQSFLAHSPTPPPSALGTDDVFDAGFLDEMPSTPRIRCISFQSSPGSSPDRDVDSSDVDAQQHIPVRRSSSSRRRTTRSSNRHSSPLNRGIMGIRITPARLGDTMDQEVDDVDAGGRHRKRVVSLQSTPEASPNHQTSHTESSSRPPSVELLYDVPTVQEAPRSSERGTNRRGAHFASESPIVVEPSPEPQLTPPRHSQHIIPLRNLSNAAPSGQAEPIRRRAVVFASGSPIAVNASNTSLPVTQSTSGSAPNNTNVAAVQPTRNSASASSGCMRVSRSGIAALNLRRPVLLNDNDESHQMPNSNEIANRLPALNNMGTGDDVQILQEVNEAIASDRVPTAAQRVSLSPSGIVVPDVLSGISPRSRRAIEAVLAEDDILATRLTASPPERGQRQRTRLPRAVATRAAELSRRNRNLGTSLLGPLRYEASSDRTASMAIDVEPAVDDSMVLAEAFAEQAAEARRRQELADYQLALRIAAEIDEDEPTSMLIHYYAFLMIERKGQAVTREQCFSV